ncbi:MAG: transglycosylase SLT domain-containing protein, partial [Bacteroidota bacterium]
MPKTYLFFFFLIFSFGSGFGQVVPAKMKLGDMQLTIESSARKQIQQDVDRLTRSPTYFNILVDRMNLYFPIIEREHKKEKVPDEIKFLVIQESALVSDAVSIANAVGFWQFKDFTAREVGLTVDRKVDERLNIVSSSRGSGKYFNFNNQFFDNWAYAVIAYQAGAGGAQKHVDSRKYGEKRLTITTKTYWYLKKFIAHVVAFSPYLGKPHSEGIWLLEDTNAGGKTLEQLAKKHKVELEELQTYNKWLKRGPVPTDRTYTVLIPKKGQRPKTSQRENEKELAKIEKPITKTYPKQLKPGLGEEGTITVIPLNRIPAVLAKPGENLHRLSARVGLTEEKFRSFNDLKADEDLQENEFYYLKKKKNKS